MRSVTSLLWWGLAGCAALHAPVYRPLNERDPNATDPALLRAQPERPCVVECGPGARCNEQTAQCEGGATGGSMSGITEAQAIRIARAAVPFAVKQGTAVRRTRGPAQATLEIPETVKARCTREGDDYRIVFDTEQVSTLNGSVLAEVRVDARSGVATEVVTYY